MSTWDEPERHPLPPASFDCATCKDTGRVKIPGQSDRPCHCKRGDKTWGES